MSTETPTIPGFNTSLALRQLGNNIKLYTKLLDQFQKSYDSVPREIAENVASGDFETAERSAHTIKGLAGSLGASTLQEVSAVLEKQCKARNSGPEFTQALATFGEEVALAITAIRGYLAQSAQAVPQGAPAGVNASQLASQLAALAAHVDESDARALMLFDEMRANLETYDKNAAARLASAFELFDFTAAAEVIAVLRARFR